MECPYCRLMAFLTWGLPRATPASSTSRLTLSVRGFPSRLLSTFRQVPGRTRSMHAPSGELWRTFANPQLHIHKNLPDIQQTSGEGPLRSPSAGEGAFCMWVAFRMCPTPPWPLALLRTIRLGGSNMGMASLKPSYPVRTTQHVILLNKC